MDAIPVTNSVFVCLCENEACWQVQQGVFAIFGPSDPFLGSHVQSICDALEIPHLEARFDADHSYKPFSINVHPPLDQINQAFMDVMFFLNWTKVAIIYEEDQGSFLTPFTCQIFKLGHS